MKTILFLLALMFLACGGLYAKAQAKGASSTQFISSCFDHIPQMGFTDFTPKVGLGQAMTDASYQVSTSAKIRDTLLAGYELVKIDKVSGDHLSCLYHFEKSRESLATIQAQMARYEQTYQSLLGADLKLKYDERKLDQNARLFTKNARNILLYDYRTSPYLNKDMHLHVFIANCEYPKGTVWDAITRETELNLTLRAVLSSHHAMGNQCLYYFVPDLQKFTP